MENTTLIIGNGRIGKALYYLYPQEMQRAVVIVDTLEEARTLCPHPAEIFSCVPYFATVDVAKFAVDCGADYCDFTESDECRKIIEALPWGKQQKVIAGSGLAPGYINMLAGRLERQVENPEVLEMMCGALPQDRVCNPLGYQISWSVDGLIKEYSTPCEIKQNGGISHIPALEGYEILHFSKYPGLEAFFTSGGAGTTTRTLRSKSISYKTLRYYGHLNNIQPLIRSSQPETAIVNACGTLTGPDIVYIAISVRSFDAELWYMEAIRPQQGLTAIQYATAMGAIKVWKETACLCGFIRPENL